MFYLYLTLAAVGGAGGMAAAVRYIPRVGELLGRGGPGPVIRG
jgi:hypothetical protein